MVGVGVLYSSPLPGTGPRVGQVRGRGDLCQVRVDTSSFQRREIEYREEVNAVAGVALPATSSNLLNFFGGRTQVLHFVGSGVDSVGLLLETSEGFEHALRRDSFQVFQSNSSHKPCVFLSSRGALYSDEATQAFLELGTPVVIHLKTPNDEFVRAFYARLTSVKQTGFEENLRNVLKDFGETTVNVEVFRQQGVADVQINLSDSHKTCDHSMPSQGFFAPVPGRFVGRIEELRLLCSMFLNWEVRGVVISGVKGSGKTSLALMAGQFAFDRKILRRVYFVNCNQVDIPVLSSQVVAGLSSFQAELVRNMLWAFKLISYPFAKETDILAALVRDVATVDLQSERQVMDELALQIKRVVVDQRSADLVTRFANVMKSRLEAALGNGKGLVIFDSCEGISFSNDFFLVTLREVFHILPVRALFCSTHYLLFEKLHKFLYNMKLEGMISKDAQAILELSSEGADLNAVQTLLLSLQQKELCLPISLLECGEALAKHVSAAKDSTSGVVASVVAKAKTSASQRVYEDLRYLLSFSVQPERVEQGVELWKKCAKLSGTPTFVPTEEFKRQLKAFFDSSSVPGASMRPLSPQTLDSLLSLRSVTPLVPGMSEHVSLSRFAARFWPWWTRVLDTLSSFREPLWSKRVYQNLPLIWLDSRGRACKRLEGQAPGVFSIRFSESSRGALAIEYVRENGKIHSFLVEFEGVEPVCLGRTYPSLSSLIMAQGELKYVYSQNSRVGKDKVFLCN